MGKFTVHSVEAPAHWGPYLINRDASGYTPEEVEEIKAWETSIGLGEPVSAADTESMGRWNGQLCLLTTYDFLRPESSPAASFPSPSLD
jgi:hypothetical protein